MKRVFVALLGAALAAAWPAIAAEAPPNFIVYEQPRTVPEIHFDDEAGQSHSLEEFRGKVVLLNIWATWCGPCRKEMPTLDRLQSKLGGTDFEVIALSIDRSGMEAVTKFYGEIGIKHLAKYVDPSSRALGDLGAPGLPTTLLIDREGREIGRLIGPAEWDSPDMVAFIQSRLAKQTGLIIPKLSHAQATNKWSLSSTMKGTGL